MAAVMDPERGAKTVPSSGQMAMVLPMASQAKTGSGMSAVTSTLPETGA